MELESNMSDSIIHLNDDVMKKEISIPLLSALLLLLVSCGTTAYVQKDRTYDFSKVKTYAWVPVQKDSLGKKRVNDLVGTRIRQSVNKNLAANGWKEDNRRPDVLLVYDVDVQKETRSVSNPVYSYPTTRWFYNPYNGRYLPVYYPSQLMGYRNDKEIVNEGTFTITLMDAATEKTIWQGWTTSEVNGRRLTDKEIDENVKAIIRKLS